MEEEKTVASGIEGISFDRRGSMLIMTGAGLAAASALAGCASLFGTAGGASTTWVQNLLGAIASIQSQVRSRLAGLCTIANSMVPNIDSALAALKAALDVTGIGATTDIPITAVTSAVDGIVAFGCPSPAPAPTAIPGGGFLAAAPPPTTATVNGKPVHVVWI